MKIGGALLVGAGGIGSHVAEQLARLLHAHPNGFCAMEIIDGDDYEEKNVERQMFPHAHTGRGKAEVLAKRVCDSIPLLSDGAFHEFVDSTKGYVNSDVDAAGSIVRLYTDVPHEMSGEPTAVLVVLAVDNDATRRLFYDSVNQLPLSHPDLVIVDASNDLETATVSTSFWKGRKSLLVSPVEKYENLRDPKDRVPGGGCQAQAPSTPQLMVANMSAALMVMLTVQALLDGKQFSDDLQANVRTFTIGVAGGLYGG